MNVFVIFSPGLGGNHLANMIATSPRFQSRVTPKQYHSVKNDPSSFRNVKDAHYSTVKHLSNLEIIKDYTNNVLCGHFMEYYYTDHSLFIEKQAVIIETPKDENSYAWKRWQTYNKGRMHSYYAAEQENLYSPKLVETVLGIDDHWTIPAESLITEKPPLELLQSMTYNIDVEFCKEMHNHWIKSNLNLI